MYNFGDGVAGEEIAEGAAAAFCRRAVVSWMRVFSCFSQFFSDSSHGFGGSCSSFFIFSVFSPDFC